MRFVQVNDIASVASELAVALRKRGHHVDLLYPKLHGAGLPPLGKLAVSPLRFVDWMRLAWRLRRGNYDAVHIHYAYLGIVGLLARVPYVLHCHGDDVRDVDRRVWAPLIRLALKRARHVYYSTPDLREALMRIRPDAEFLPNPIDIEQFHPCPLPPDAEDVLVACALAENKGVSNILAACRILAGARPEARVTAVAGGSGTAEAESLPNVLLLMHQPRAKLPSLMARHRVIVGQVYQGAVGMVELESLACARPVVAWFTYPEAYEEPPPFVQALTGEAIAAAVTRLLEDPAEAARIGAESRAWVERQHNAVTIAGRIEALAIRLSR
ncbi:MAG: glycosyltransferase family 4 protein [Dehalococcoidia bacterium]|jgi:glycosyltransferase involved in cell wall biosynthesis|uniref:glycosyltransferase family 4 protein n=1 Tax=Candidatus Amarobacter glycogenicus TaxID=3140699 RepID=UPI003134AA8D|nr:glycosyltransferase family 4 protein [Dehalococcoidia bacterium]MBK7126705.1 glycosyltransferase family 4 protein [Dehalococcoidia bacterium]MBK8561594.1 glycosyltransferase family 4 protein [Dehalococcoidia bacterium]MCC6267373.1 glycosyltransferase family 4 protein [Dehalococcoidia bacterium]